MSDHDPDLVARATRTMRAIRTMVQIILTSSILGVLWLLWRLCA